LIQPITSGLPTIIHPVIIDATPPALEPAQTITLDGLKLPENSGQAGLIFVEGADGSSVKGIRIQKFEAGGIWISNASNCVIGGPNTGDDNVIVDNPLGRGFASKGPTPRTIASSTITSAPTRLERAI
jgi:hypothetical protein